MLWATGASSAISPLDGQRTGVQCASGSLPSSPCATAEADPRPDADRRLAPGFPAVDAGRFLTTFTADANRTDLAVEEATPFFDGWQIEGLSGDTVKIDGGTATARVVTVDYRTCST